MVAPIVREFSKKTHKKCIKCREWKSKDRFGIHADNADGKQVICYNCKGTAAKLDRARNTGATLKHHIATRCQNHLGDLCPPNISKNLELHLGYKIPRLVDWLRKDIQAREGAGRKLRDALEEGYHIDHIRPLSSFAIVVVDPNGCPCVDWHAFEQAWAIENLSAIPGIDNLVKGAKYDTEQNGDVSEDPQ